jgi:hypothetical protein
VQVELFMIPIVPSFISIAARTRISFKMTAFLASIGVAGRRRLRRSPMTMAVFHGFFRVFSAALHDIGDCRS